MEISGEKHFARKSLRQPAGHIVSLGLLAAPYPASERSMLIPKSKFGKRESRFRRRIGLKGNREICSTRLRSCPRNSNSPST
jgi:hypothetical protein